MAQQQQQQQQAQAAFDMEREDWAACEKVSISRCLAMQCNQVDAWNCLSLPLGSNLPTVMVWI